MKHKSKTSTQGPPMRHKEVEVEYDQQEIVLQLQEGHEITDILYSMGLEHYEEEIVEELVQLGIIETDTDE